MFLMALTYVLKGVFQEDILDANSSELLLVKQDELLGKDRLLHLEDEGVCRLGHRELCGEAEVLVGRPEPDGGVLQVDGRACRCQRAGGLQGAVLVDGRDGCTEPVDC